MATLPPWFERFGKKVQTTNPIAQALGTLDPSNAPGLTVSDFDSMLRLQTDFDRYEEKEKEIPALLYEVLKKESTTFTRLVKRSYVEADAWLVQVQCMEGESLQDHDQEVYSGSVSGEMVPALFEEGDVAAHFVKIHVPKIFVRALALPMIHRNH